MAVRPFCEGMKPGQAHNPPRLCARATKEGEPPAHNFAALPYPALLAKPKYWGDRGVGMQQNHSPVTLHNTPNGEGKPQVLR